MEREYNFENEEIAEQGPHKNRDGVQKQPKRQECQREQDWRNRGEVGDSGCHLDTPLTPCPASLIFQPQEPISCSSPLRREIIKEI